MLRINQKIREVNQGIADFFTWLGNFFEDQIKPILAALVYLRVPLTVSLVSFIVFIFIDQTIEIYRSIILDQNKLEAFLSSFFVTILSILVWYSGRLLQKNYAIRQEVANKKTEQENNNNEIYLKIIPRILGIIPSISFCLGIFKAYSNFVNVWFLFLFVGCLVNLTFLILNIKAIIFPPQKKYYSLLFSSVIFSLGLIYSINRIESQLEIDEQYFFAQWILISFIAAVVILTLSIGRRYLFNQTIFQKGQLLYFTKLNYLFGSDDSDENIKKGLFDSYFENIFVNIAYICFSAVAFSVIAKNNKFSLGAGLIFILGIILNIILSSFLYSRNEDENTPEFGKTKKQIIILTFISLGSSLCFLLFIPTINLINTVGAVSILAIALSIYVVIFSTIYNWGLINKIPALSILIVILVAASLFNLNDNHKFRQLKVNRSDDLAAIACEDDNVQGNLPSVYCGFSQWLESRKDKDKYTANPYPVYIVSTQGGGIFAAYHSATALSRLQENYPQFAQHIFAISSVSGGSLGASVFSSLIKENQINEIETKAKDIFSENLLSPLLSMALFPDFLQRFQFLSINGWDRALGLEIAFEEAWHNNIGDVGDKNPLKESYYKHWNPTAEAPALVINTTEVETGEPLRISPFQIPLPKGDENIFDESGINLRLSTAAGLSARFPLVTPVGWYRKSKTETKSRLVDGGYFDNSGVSTALDIGRALESEQGNNKKLEGKQFKIIYLSIVDSPYGVSTKEKSNQGLNELGSPIRASLNVRTTRGNNIVRQAKFLLNNDESKSPFEYTFRNLYLDKEVDQVKLPLGWLLSDSSRKTIDDQNPQPSECVGEIERTFKNKFEEENYPYFNDVRKHNSCVAKSISYDLEQIDPPLKESSKIN